MKNTKGLLVSIYLPSYGSASNNGLSDKHNQVVLLGVKAPFGPKDTTPGVLLEVFRGKLRAVPAEQPEGVAGPMFGGAFIYSSDSRFPADYPIPLHDRFETWEEYKTYST